MNFFKKLFSEHPVALGVGVFLVGLLALFAFGFFKKGSASSTPALTTVAYSLTSPAQIQANYAVQAQQIAANAAIAQNDNTNATTIAVNQIWAKTQEDETTANNQFQLNQGALTLDQQLNETDRLNGMNQFALNTGAFVGPEAYDALVGSGYFNQH